MSVVSFIWRYLTIGIVLTPIIIVIFTIILMWKTNFTTDEEIIAKVYRSLLDEDDDLFDMLNHDREIGPFETIRKWLLWDILLWPVYIPLLSIRVYEALKILDN